MVLPDKAYTNINAIVKTIYRLLVSKKHLLEWVTSEEAEKISKNDLLSFYKNMKINVFLGLIGIVFCKNILGFLICFSWILAPFFMWFISRKEKEKTSIELIKEKDYLSDLAKNTWLYFKDTLVKENNYLPPDNYEENRNIKFALRTSPTNIGLAILSVITSYDLGFESIQYVLDLLEKMLKTIEKLPKWNGHLYNWYDIKTLKPLIPRYISTVDSGNFISYLFVLKQFYIKIKEQIDLGKIDNSLLKYIPEWVGKKISDMPFIDADFSKLYDYEKELFSIGFNIEDNKLTLSYYDMLASEARSTSLIAIAKKDIEPKHWYNLGRTLTSLQNYKGLISWSGTSFEYLMPNIIIKKYKGSLLDESCKFMIFSQKEYAKKLNVPWGFSETAFNLKDLNGNYQYKAIGIPWLGLKRGLEDDITVSSYGSIMGIVDYPKEVIQNIEYLEKQNMRGKYGLYESIDYTPSRLINGKQKEVIKTFMAHHEALILVSINNLLNNNIMVNRFMLNEEIKAVDSLLEEKMPEDVIITNEKKVKPAKIKYLDNCNYQKVFTKPILNIDRSNFISNNEYSIVINQKGEGFSKYNDIYINRYKETSDEEKGIFFLIKNMKTKSIFSPTYNNYLENSDKYEVKFSEEKIEYLRINKNIQTKLQITIAANEPVEIRNLNIKNLGLEKEKLEVVSFFEPILSKIKQDYMHPAFNNMFLTFEYLENEKILIIKRRKRLKDEEDIYLAVSLFIDENKNLNDFFFEIDKEDFLGRENILVPKMIKEDIPFSNKVKLTINPIVALKKNIEILPQEEINISLVLGVGSTKAEAVNRIKKYERNEDILKEFEIVKAKVDAEIRYLRLNNKNIETYQKMLNYLVFINSFKNLSLINTSRKYLQSDLWKYGISGDLPILLFEMESIYDEYVLKEVLKGYEYFKYKNIKLDLVIINKKSNDYENNLKQEIINQIVSYGLGYTLNISGGIFVFDYQMVDLELFRVRSNLKIVSNLGPISRQLNDLEEEFLSKTKIIVDIYNYKFALDDNIQKSNKIDLKKLKYFNGYGGFDLNEKEYTFLINKNNNLPTVWSNILANENFGCITTNSGIGCTWSKNSRLNKLSAWNNNQVTNLISEGIFIQDEDSLKVTSLTLNTFENKKDYLLNYGFGYTNYKHCSLGINQTLTVFVPRKDSIKVNIINLKNLEAKKKKLRIFYYIKPVLGEDEEITKGYINVNFEKDKNLFILNNLEDINFNENVYISSSEKIKSYSTNKDFFIGQNNILNPEALKKYSLDNSLGISINNFIICELKVELEAFEEKNISLLFGAEVDKNNIKNMVGKYINIQNCFNELENVKRYWNDLVSTVQVKTPVESFNIMFNGWLFYQIIVSRLWGKMGFYQSGGAFGFRDQLQDMIGLKYLDENIVKNQIIEHAKHQFIEGDVLHWWHEDILSGIRTKFSDDLLFLPYIVCEYISFTKDYSILDIKTSYVQGKLLGENEDEKYDYYSKTDFEEDIFMHSMRAIKKALNFGENGLPKIGSGDWNDGLNTVGNKGKGESVWLGFFIFEVLKRFNEILKYKALKDENNKEYYEKEIIKNSIIMEKLKRNLNTIGWDGSWYRRAFFDSGEILGTIKNNECKIDGISQSWSVISDAGDDDKKYLSMEALDKYLVDKENKIIKLLTPPFEESVLEPGYIKSYLPGIRENGGQYTHGAIWAIIAETKLGFGDKAFELFNYVNPIEHSKTKEEALKYKVEPYVISADIYSAKNLVGRGGWTWYTGSASWMIEVGLSYILGLKIKDGYLEINPCVPSAWNEFSIQYKYKKSIYNINVYNGSSKNTGVKTVKLNGDIIEDKKVVLRDDGGIYNIDVYM